MASWAMRPGSEMRRSARQAMMPRPTLSESEMALALASDWKRRSVFCASSTTSNSSICNETKSCSVLLMCNVSSTRRRM
jgi:hypothetical protein